MSGIIDTVGSKSGIVGSDNYPAGVIDASVTGGAGLSGSTSLGTVTVGNLSNTAIVYPSGHVLNIKHVQVAGDATTITSGTVDTNVVITLTAADYVGGSKIYVWGEFGMRYSGWGARMRLIRSAPGSDVIMSDNYASIGGGLLANEPRESGMLCGENVITAGGADHVYKVQCVHVDGTEWINGGGSTSGKFNIIAMVVK